MTNVNKNHNASVAGTIIASVMRDTATESNRQAELIVALFDDAVHYSGHEIERIFAKSGTDLTTETDAILCGISPDFDDLMRKHFALNETIKEVKKDSRKAADIHALELMFKKIRAARIMLQRALHGVYALRALNVSKAVCANAGATKIIKFGVMDIELEETVSRTSSASALAQDGNKALRKSLNKAPATAKAPNSDAAKGESVKNSVKALGTVLSSMRSSGKTMFTVDMEDSTEQMTMIALHELMIAAFGDETGIVDTDALLAHVKTVNNNTRAAQAKAAKEKQAA